MIVNGGDCFYFHINTYMLNASHLPDYCIRSAEEAITVQQTPAIKKRKNRHKGQPGSLGYNAVTSSYDLFRIQFHQSS